MAKKKIYKDSVTGEFVSKEELKTRPAETYTQTVEVKEREEKEKEVTIDADVPAAE
jgi:hypothetical protein